MRTPVTAPGIFEHAHSLLNTANVIEGEHAEKGIAFNPNGCEVVFAHDFDCWVGDEKASRNATSPRSTPTPWR